MADFTPDKIRNIALLSHSGAGKTSLAEAFLYGSKAISRLGNVDAGNTASDYNEDEIERKTSISSSVLHAKWKDCKINIIDTPGYADFIGEAMSSIKAVDAAIIVVCGLSGVEVGTERVFDLADKVELPRIIFINRLDKENADFYKTLVDIQDRLGKKCIPVQLPIGKESSFKNTVSVLKPEEFESAGLSDEEKANAAKFKEALIEAAAESDDQLLEKYLDSGELTEEEFQKGMKSAVQSGKIIPILCGSATKEISVESTLNFIVDDLPPPSLKEEIKGTNPKDGEEASRKTAADAPFSAFVFKTISDPYVGQLSIFRIFSGSLKSDTGFYNVSQDAKERIGQLMILQGKEQVAIQDAVAGDICAVAKLKSTQTSDSLSDQASPIKFDPVVFPEPAISRAVKPHSRADEEKISDALTKLANEDMTFKISRDAQTKELIISGLGDLHLEIMVARLKKRFNVSVDVGVPKVAYKETITSGAKVQGKYKKQTGGRGQYGDVWIEIEPLPEGEDFEFVNKIVGGAIPRNFIPSVEKGVKAAMQEGALAKCPLVGVRVILYDGSFHAVDSSDMAFQRAGSMALKKAVLEAKPVLLEPIMDVEVMVSEDFMGGITGDINGRRGRIMGMEAKGKVQVVKAQVPLAEMLKYSSELRSITGGRGSYAMRFSHYEQIPQKFAQPIIAAAKGTEEEEKE